MLDAALANSQPSEFQHVTSSILTSTSARARSIAADRSAIHLATGVAFLVVFAQPLLLLVRDWWTHPEAGHGLLLAPLALWLGWKSRVQVAAPAVAFGISVLVVSVLLRYAAGLAAELYSMRVSMLLALAALALFFRGWDQLRRWWLVFTLLLLSIPLPEVVIGTISLPLQLMASKLGATLLDARHVPVQLAGNIIRLPGQDLFVAEACSGLRSLTALFALGTLLGGVSLERALTRWVVVALVVPVAVLGNALRVFITGFLVHYVDASAGQGFLHTTEGWLMFIGAFSVLGALVWLGRVVERRWAREGDHA